jgi:hypothetical protein
MGVSGPSVANLLVQFIMAPLSKKLKGFCFVWLEDKAQEGLLW